ncbi:hypothetical protein COO60DRAFT_524029 [Scenedesmus sp. NREL 46B-D3]|nr:hypothetical protein COO60DRAFT_524029 [Scenedesmus sp. NREL 46B-D3]
MSTVLLFPSIFIFITIADQYFLVNHVATAGADVLAAPPWHVLQVVRMLGPALRTQIWPLLISHARKTAARHDSTGVHRRSAVLSADLTRWLDMTPRCNRPVTAELSF